MSGEISKNKISQFIRTTKFKNHFLGLSSFVIGMKLADLVFYDH